MKSLQDSTPHVHLGNAEDWPSWVDDFRWEVGPDPDDASEASELLDGDDWDADEPTPDDVLEQQAGESLAQDRLERGLRCF